jgi:hypothetical protein
VGMNDRVTIHPLLSRTGHSLWLGYLDTDTVMVHGDTPCKGVSVMRKPVVSETSRRALLAQLKLKTDELIKLQTARGFTVYVKPPRQLGVPRS